METAIIELPKLQEADALELETYRTQALSVGEEATLIAKAIHNAETAEAAAQWCAGKLGWCERIKTGFLGRMRDLWHKGHKETCSQIAALVDPVEVAVGTVKAGIRNFRAIEAKRIADENARLLAEARKKDEETRLAAAIKAEESGHKPIAEAILAQTGNFVAPVVQQAKSKTQIGKMVWKIRVDPLKKGELLKMIAEKPDLHPFVAVDEGKILKQARLMDGNLNWPGVTCYQEEELGIRKAY